MSAMDAHHQIRHSIQGRNGSGDTALSRSYSTAAAVTTSTTTQPPGSDQAQTPGSCHHHLRQCHPPLLHHDHQARQAQEH